ncbi:MAG: hypothetical protein MN733_13820 [Nitrososphaera sp.]|nr:hypothetical protein [Nitrososphaera sp.]
MNATDQAIAETNTQVSRAMEEARKQVKNHPSRAKKGGQRPGLILEGTAERIDTDNVPPSGNVKSVQSPAKLALPPNTLGKQRGKDGVPVNTRLLAQGVEELGFISLQAEKEAASIRDNTVSRMTQWAEFAIKFQETKPEDLKSYCWQYLQSLQTHLYRAYGVPEEIITQGTLHGIKPRGWPAELKSCLGTIRTQKSVTKAFLDAYQKDRTKVLKALGNNQLTFVGKLTQMRALTAKTPPGKGKGDEDQAQSEATKRVEAVTKSFAKLEDDIERYTAVSGIIEELKKEATEAALVNLIRYWNGRRAHLAKKTGPLGKEIEQAAQAA